VSEYLSVLLFAAIPALSNLAGGVIAEFMPVSKRTLSLALHLATGIVIGVVGLELAPEAFEASPLVVPILAFTGGGIVFLAFEHVTDKHLVSSPEDSGAWSVFGAVSLDLFSDGVMIGTATLIDPTLGLLLAIGQAPADLPEGFAAVATFKGTRMTRRRRLGLALAFAIPIVLGATIGYWALRPAPFLVQASVLALTGGTLLAVVIEEVIPQAHQEVDSRFAAGMVVVGFALFALLSIPLGA